MIDCSVPLRISLCIGTGTVTVEVSVRFCMRGVAAALPDLLKTVLHQQPAEFPAGEDAQPTQQLPRRE